MTPTTKKRVILGIQILGLVTATGAGGVVMAVLRPIAVAQPGVVGRVLAEIGVFGISVTTAHHVNRAVQNELFTMLHTIDEHI